MISALLQDQEPLLIAGPCSVESEEQIYEAARLLARNPAIKALRGGIWKPRTMPGSFEGIGAQALPWLKKAGLAAGLPVVTEVANAQHVELALEAGVDMLWIGARTTVNPFYVQEIADALQGVSIPVLVKNPIHPEVKLWIGALERLENAGISECAAIHRGFYGYQTQPFRNDPKWEVFFELRTQRPDLPVICDPSHIAGKGELIREVSQSALDLGMDGLMIESHPNPSRALSDARQQISPQELHQLLEQLEFRQEAVQDEQYIEQLEDLRSSLDQIDQELIDTLRRRIEVVRQIGPVKHAHRATVFQMRRWFKVLENRKNYGSSQGLPPQIIHELFQLIHKYSIDIQLETKNPEKNQS